MEENFVNTRTISSRDGSTSNRPRIMSEIEQLLVHIVKTTGGGGKLHLELVDRIVQHRTGRKLSALVDDAVEEVNILEYIKRNLPLDSPLVVNIEEESLYLRCEWSTLDCSAEMEDSLLQVKNQIKVSWDITELDLSRRSFSSLTELLEVCECARVLKKLILRDIQIETCSEETPAHSSLIERIKWHCPSLEDVDVTGCSPSILDVLFQTSRNPIGCTFGVNVIDLLSNKPEAKELLMPPPIASDVSGVANRIKVLVQEGLPANTSYDGWSLLHTASIIADADLVRWLLDKSGRHKYHIVNSRRLTALDVAILCHNAPIVKQLLHETDRVDPAKLVDLCLLSQLRPNEKHDVLHRNHSSDCNPLQVVQLFIENSPLDYKASLFIEFIKGFRRTVPRELREKTCWTEESMSEMFKALVSSGVSPDIPIKDLGGRSPLMCAVSSPTLVKMFLNLGSNIHAVDEVGNTALFYAVNEASKETDENHFQSSKTLIESNADVNFRNKYGETPILYDAFNSKSWSEESNLKTWDLLVQSGADIASQNKERRSLIHLVIERTKRYLEELPNSNPVQETWTLSQTAIAHCIQQIKFVSKHNSKLAMSRDSMGNTPLHLLADHNSSYTDEMLRVAEALIEMGNNVKVVNDQGRTPLHLAISWSMAKFLLNQEAKPNVTDDAGCTPMLCRAKETNVEKTLNEWSEGVKFGMDLWVENNDGQNVFHVLMERGKFDVLQTLIEASINNERGSILRTDSKDNNLLHNLCNYNDSRVIPLIDVLLKSGAAVNGQNKNGDTALHIACRGIVSLPQRKSDNCVLRKAVPKLRAYGADCNLTNNTKVTVKNIAHLDKKLRKAIARDVRQQEPQAIYPWREESQKYHGLLSAAARGQNCQKIGDYCYNVHPIGSGAFSKVYAAINVQDGREVALKRADTYRLKTRQDDREVRSLVQLAGCPQVVRYISFARETDFTWIVLELMEGTLNDLLLEGSYQDFLPTLCKDFLLGVTYLHSNNILHRDLKPTNVLYSRVPKLCLKIADFGLSKKLGAVQGSSVLHSNAGSRFWMAPELLLSTGHLRHTYASDVFACGLIMHYMLAKRRHPFQGSTSDGHLSIADWNAVEANISTGSKTLSPNLSDEAKDMLAHLLSHESKDRPKASDMLKHPFFWSEDKKVRFLCSVANQSEIGTFGKLGSSPSPVELEIENNLASMFNPSWDALFPAVYTEMASSSRARRYHISSGVHLLRFIRNAYTHVSDASRPTSFQKLLLEDRIFFKTLPSLFMVIFKAVENGNWHTSREEIKSIINSDD